MLNSSKNISLDDLLVDPGKVRALPRTVRNDLLARCAAAILMLSSGDDVAEPKPAAPVKLSERSESPILLTVPEVAARLGYRPSNVYEMVRAGRLPAVRDRKFVRVLESALAAYIADHEQCGPLPKRVSNMLKSSHDRQRTKTLPQAARPDAARTRPTDRSSPDHSGEMGERNGCDS